jgi:hypothetical protein
VSAAGGELRFFFDESVLGVGKALALARSDIVHAGHRLIPEVPLGTLDPVWMPLVAAKGLTVIGRDKKIRSKPGELALLHDHGLRVFWIAGKRDRSNWDNLCLLVRRWDDVERLVAERGPGPWFMAINEGNITEIRLRPPPGSRTTS